MRLTLCISAIALVFASAATAAEPKEEVAAAAKKLGEMENYGWTANVEGGGFSSVTEGKAAKDAVLLSMTIRDNTLEVVLQGKKGVMKTDDGWQSLQELAESEGETQPPFARFLARRFLGYKAPAEEVADLVSKAKELKAADGAIVGDLTEEGAKEILSFRRPGANAPLATVTNAKASVKIWVKDGMLSKYELHRQGTVEFNGNTRDVDNTTTVEVKDVGSTKVEIPADAKAKLS